MEAVPLDNHPISDRAGMSEPCLHDARAKQFLRHGNANARRPRAHYRARVQDMYRHGSELDAPVEHIRPVR